jgi:hypothetical protein
VLLAAGGLLCGHVTTPLRMQLVGFTAAGFTGDTGVLDFTLACQAEFPESRMCNSVEVLETIRVPSSLEGHAWVRPVFQPAASAGFTMFALDAAGGGAQEVGNLSCRSWRANDLMGLTVDATGSFVARECDTPRAVTCCAMLP